MSSIEDVKKKLEEAEVTDEEGDDALNPFYKQGESHKGAGRKKVVSLKNKNQFFWVFPTSGMNTLKLFKICFSRRLKISSFLKFLEKEHLARYTFYLQRKINISLLMIIEN